MTRPRDNPFRAQCVDAIVFEPQGQTWEALIVGIEKAGWRGAIAGPHGSGKTTLMRRLREEAATRGREVRHVFLTADLSVDAETWKASLDRVTDDTIVFIDGFDHLWWWQRFEAAYRTTRAGLVVTTHCPTRLLQTIVQTQTTPALLAKLIRHLTDDTTADDDHIKAIYQSHAGNLREAFREMYDHCAKQ